MQAWEDFLTRQERDLGQETVKRWLRPLKVTDYDACNLFLEAKDSFQVMWFEEHVRPKVLSEFVNNNNRKIRVHLTVAEEGATPQKPYPYLASKKKKNKPQKELTLPPFQLQFDELDPHATFSNLISIQGHTLAYKVLCECTGFDPETQTSNNTPQTSPPPFNPIYLWGPTGSGKTHLLMATAQILQERGLKVIFCRAETFTEHVVTAIRAGEMHKFRQAYRHTDVLLIDDVQVFSRKSATQEELFHTFNSIHVEGKQILLAANCTPLELQLIEPRLVSRFEWGIVLELPTPSKKEIRELLRAKTEVLNFPLEQRAEDLLLDTFTSSPKALMRALEALVLRLHLNQKTRHMTPKAVGTVLVKNLLQDLIKEEEQTALTPQKIIDTVAEFYDIPPEDILGKSQRRECTMPRKIAMYLCRKELEIPFMKIGDTFSRDHSTVMTSIKQIKKRLDDQEKETAGAVSNIHKRLAD